MSTARARTAAWAFAGALWALGVAAGTHAMMRYEATPGAAASAPSRWPPSSALARNDGRATVVLFAHPQCPCTRASLGELAELLARVPTAPTAYVLFRSLPGAGELTRGALWRTASAIPGVVVREDREGAEARRFGASTSGQTVAYDSTGRLLFSGGITAGRGHRGDNAGRQRLTAVLRELPPDRAEGPVFGCSLADRAERETPRGNP